MESSTPTRVLVVAHRTAATPALTRPVSASRITKLTELAGRRCAAITCVTPAGTAARAPSGINRPTTQARTARLKVKMIRFVN